MLVEAIIPDEAIARLDPPFPPGWDSVPETSVSRAIGDAWLAAAASLALIEPEGLQWFIERSQYNPKRPRAHFALANAFYDLPVTDPAWMSAFRDLDHGLHPARACGLPPDRKLLLTISLGDEFEADGYCYKLVAGLVAIRCAALATQVH